MKQLIFTVFVICALVMPASAQFSTFNGSDGTSGTIYNYGNGFQGYQFNGPAGPISGSIYTAKSTSEIEGVEYEAKKNGFVEILF